MKQQTFDLLLWTATVSYLSFYFGHYYGWLWYRIARYYKLRFKRWWKHGSDYKKRVILNA